MAGRVSQLVLEASDIWAGAARVTQLVVEVGDVDPGFAFVSQLTVEVGDVQAGFARCSQLVVEVLIPNVDFPMPMIYPELIGLGFSQIRRSIFNNAIQPHVSQREVRIAYADEGLYEWDLTYEVLRDFERGSIPSELQRLFGFYRAVRGTFLDFLFHDKDDCRVAQQLIATTDGVASTFLLVRTYGDESYGNPTPATITEAVGFVNLGEQFNVYLDGVNVSADDPVNGWQVVTTIPRTQQLKFNNTPAAGKVVRVDMSFYFLCRFAADSQDFEKFYDKLWLAKTVTLHSLKGGT